MKWKSDKTKHLLVSFALVVLLYILTSDVVSSLTYAIIIGIGKEVYDEFFAGGSGYGDVQDIFADVVGVFLGAIFITIMSVLCP